MCGLSGIFTYDCLQDQTFNEHPTLYEGLAYNTGVATSPSNLFRRTGKGKRSGKGKDGSPLSSSAKFALTPQSPVSPGHMPQSPMSPSSRRNSPLSQSSSAAVAPPSNLFSKSNIYTAIPSEESQLQGQGPQTPKVTSSKPVSLDDNDIEVGIIHSNASIRRGSGQSHSSTPSNDPASTPAAKATPSNDVEISPDVHITLSTSADQTPSHSTIPRVEVDTREAGDERAGTPHEKKDLNIGNIVTPSNAMRKRASFGDIEMGVLSDVDSDAATSPPGNTNTNGADNITLGSVQVSSQVSQPLIPMPISHSVLQNVVNTQDPGLVLERDDDLLKLRCHIQAEFKEAFDAGVTSYLAGDWPGARNHLRRANESFKNHLRDSFGLNVEGDGPCMVLLEYMEQRHWTAPADWKGFRPLTSK